jgi:hypothetical protein
MPKKPSTRKPSRPDEGELQARVRAEKERASAEKKARAEKRKRLAARIDAVKKRKAAKLPGRSKPEEASAGGGEERPMAVSRAERRKTRTRDVHVRAHTASAGRVKQARRDSR